MLLQFKLKLFIHVLKKIFINVVLYFVHKYEVIDK